MSGTSLLLLSVSLIALGGGGLFAWMKFGPALVESEEQRVARRVVELAARIALESARSKHAITADEIETIEAMLMQRAPRLRESPAELVKRLLLEPADPKAAARAVDELTKLTSDPIELRWVLDLLSAVIYADDFVEPEEAYFFEKIASRLGWEAEDAEKKFGVRGLKTEEYKMAKRGETDEA